MSVTDTFVAVQNKKELQDHQRVRKMEIETFNDNEFDREWQQNVNISVQYVDQLHLTLDTQFQQMCDGCLGQIEMANPHLKRTQQDVRPINSASSCPRLKARKFEKEDIFKMFPMNVTDPAKSGN